MSPFIGFRLSGGLITKLYCARSRMGWAWFYEEMPGRTLSEKIALERLALSFFTKSHKKGVCAPRRQTAGKFIGSCTLIR